MPKQKIYILTILIGLANFPGLSAQLSPGELHHSHADLEGLKNCSKCHGVGKKILAENCLSCHILLQERISRNQGLHARPEFRNCEQCHVEHHGRDFELIWWPEGQSNFDHQQTGFELQGKHLQLACRDCHQAKYIRDKDPLTARKKNLDLTFLGLQRDCLNCHQDEHRGQLNKDCLSCHQMDAFRPAPLFDHSRSRFPLTGRHQQTACEKCHPLLPDQPLPGDPDFRKYRDLTFRECRDCHQDVHQNRFGLNCSGCHNTSGWRNYNQQAFDHQRTRYPLQGEHLKVSCEKCHTPGRPLKPLSFGRCRDCHSDYHQGQFTHRPQKGACEECHTVQGFSPAQFTIDQHNLTSFKLEGSHLAVPCILCHKSYPAGTRQEGIAGLAAGQETIRFKYGTTGCNYCHTDPHAGTVEVYLKNEGCEFCHSVNSWREIRFDHGKTDFPLEFKHLTLACTACHKPDNRGKIRLDSLPARCPDCHKDPHAGQFTGTDRKTTGCERCHNPQGWKNLLFDHNSMAAFKLEGAHQRASCDKCHKQNSENGIIFTRYKPIPHDCADCHGKQMKPEDQP